MKFQKFRLNRIKYLILILLYMAFTPSVKAMVSPTNDFYINDYANILSSETENYILNKSIALNNVDGTQIVVVTVPDLEGMSLEDYATQLFRNFGIGDKNKNNGLLLLLALEERQFRVEVGYGLEGILPDGKTGRFQDEYIIPYLKNNNWDEGIKNGYDAFYKEIVTLNNLNIDYNNPNEVDSSSTSIKSGDDYGFIFMILVCFFYLIGGGIGNKIRRLKKNKGLYTLIYIIVWLLVCIFFYYTWTIYLILMFFNLVVFLSSRFGFGSGTYFGGGSFSGRGSSSGRSSSGGGGSSGGV